MFFEELVDKVSHEDFPLDGVVEVAASKFILLYYKSHSVVTTAFVPVKFIVVNEDG